MSIDSALNLRLPAAPLTQNQEIAAELQIVYNALRILQQVLDDAGITGGTTTSSTVIDVAHGGTGAVTLTGIVKGAGTAALVGISSSNAGHVLKCTGADTYAFQAGGYGDVTGPAGATDGNIAVYDGATGKLIKDTGYRYCPDNLVLPKTSGKGILVDTAAPTYGWRDLLGIIQPKTSGVGSPTLAVFRAGQVRRFCYAVAEDGDGEFHIPHDWAPGTDIHIHVHWGHNGTAISGSLVLSWFFTYAKGHNQANFSAEIAPTQTVSTPDIATVPQYRHRIDEFQLTAASPSATQLDTDDIEVDGLIMYHWDVTTIPTITGGSPNKPFLFYIDLHYQSTGIGTKQKAPGFYT